MRTVQLKNQKSIYTIQDDGVVSYDSPGGRVYIYGDLVCPECGLDIGVDPSQAGTCQHDLDVPQGE